MNTINNLTREVSSIRLIGAITISLLIVNSCIDPFEPEIKDYESYLVVDGQITDENKAYEVFLSRTSDGQGNWSYNESGAIVTISSDAGENIILTEFMTGRYRTTGSDIRGTIGRSYSLNIRTRDGKVYGSEPVMLEPVPDIDSISYVVDEQFNNEGSSKDKGIQLSVEFKNSTSGTQYLRWEYEEDWKFRVSYAVRYKYVSGGTAIPVDIVNQYCWKHDISRDILLQSAQGDQPNKRVSSPLMFIPSALSDRLTVRYSIKVRQYSLSRSEYEFWSNLRQVSEAGGDVFDKQPFSVSGNIRNLSDPAEPVLGYFQVSAVKEKRQYLSGMDIFDLRLPAYNPKCEYIIAARADYEPPRPTLDQIYSWYTSAGYVMVDFWEEETGNKLIFSKPVCSDCTLTGNPLKPLFWID